MLTFIFQEHNEGSEFISKMLSQVEAIPQKKEVVIVSSSLYPDFFKKYSNLNLSQYDFNVTLIGGINSCGAARNVGAKTAIGEDLIFCDMHVCFAPEAVMQLLQTLNTRSNAVVAPSLAVGEFPSCKVSGGIAHGVVFRFVDTPFQWVWEPAETNEHEFEAPCCCGCAFSMKKKTYDVLAKYGGFLGTHVGLSWEEEMSIRLWRLGHPTFIEPRCTFSHYFKSQMGHKRWDSHSTEGYYKSRVAGVYINVFDSDIYEHIAALCKTKWGDEWAKNLRVAKREYGWLRRKLELRKDKIDERWFFRTE